MIYTSSTNLTAQSNGRKKLFLILYLEIMNINTLTLYSSQYFWYIVSYLFYIIELYYIVVFNFVGVLWYNKMPSF